MGEGFETSNSSPEESPNRRKGWNLEFECLAFVRVFLPTLASGLAQIH
jgi:hypothetical protein